MVNDNKFKFPIDDKADEVDDELEYFTDDTWSDYDPYEEEGYDDDYPFDRDLDEDEEKVDD